MDIGRPKRKYTIEPIEDPLRRERPIEQPAPPEQPEREQPERIRAGAQPSSWASPIRSPPGPRM